MDVAAISDLLTVWGYPVLLLLLLSTGIGSPIPEDLLLVTAGYLIATGVFVWSVALPLSLLGVVGSDLMLYSAGRHLSWRSSRRPTSSWISAVVPCPRRMAVSMPAAPVTKIVKDTRPTGRAPFRAGASRDPSHPDGPARGR